MGHNYARPASPDARLLRLLNRIPADWGVAIERPPGGGWSAGFEPPGAGVTWGTPQPTLEEALADAWKLAGQPRG